MLDKPLARYGRAKRGLSLAGGNPARLNLAAAVNRTYLRGLARNQSVFKAAWRASSRASASSGPTS